MEDTSGNILFGRILYFPLLSSLSELAEAVHYDPSDSEVPLHPALMLDLSLSQGCRRPTIYQRLEGTGDLDP